MEYIWRTDSPLGKILLAADGAALCGLWFEGQKHFAESLLPVHEEKLLPVFEQTITWLEIYFSGKKPDFTPPLQMKGTAFQRTVWERLLQIPYGETVSYGEIAQYVAQERNLSGISARAVGTAVGRNAISLIVPCHRVIGADGRLTGYAGGIERKRWLIAHEQAAVK